MVVSCVPPGSPRRSRGSLGLTALALIASGVLSSCHRLFPHRVPGAGDAAADLAEPGADLPLGVEQGVGLDGGARRDGTLLTEASAPAPLALDASFAGAGFVTVDGSQHHEDYAAGAVVDGQGRIVVTGMVTVGFTPPSAYNKDLALFRYRADGTPDANFGTNGMVTFHQKNWDWGRGLALTPEGKIVVGGNIDNLYDRPTIWRFSEDGTPDASFGTLSGHTAVAVASAEVQGVDLAVDPANGEFALLGNQQDAWLTVARLTTGGTLQKSFAGSGFVIYTGLPTVTGARLAFDATGRLVVAGRSRPGGAVSDTDLTLLRFLANGTLDPGFAGNGVLTHDGAAGTKANEAASSLELDAQGNIYACGAAANRLAVWKVRQNGSLDPGYGAQGVVVDLAGAASAEAGACRLDGAGRLVVAGTSSDAAGKPALTIWRLLPSGALDASLEGKGFGKLDAFPALDQHVRSLTLAGGKAIVCGHVGTGAASDAVVWRLLLP